VNQSSLANTTCRVMERVFLNASRCNFSLTGVWPRVMSLACARNVTDYLSVCPRNRTPCVKEQINQFLATVQQIWTDIVRCAQPSWPVYG
jgi:hypothetical protein